MKNKNMNQIGMIILLGIFLIFYMVATFFLDRKVPNNQVEVNPPLTDNVTGELTNTEYLYIANNLYSDFRILYDVVNNKFKVDQEDKLEVGEITYKKIINFDDVMNKIFTENGLKKFLKDLDKYFAITDNGVYLAGNLVTYQTYYFRGDDTNIYIIEKTDNYFKAIVYEKWTSNGTNTLATVDFVKEGNSWLVDNVVILANKQGILKEK